MDEAQSTEKHHPKNCQCPVCKVTLDFELDNDLVTEIDKGNAVIFAGAGISTESRMVYNRTFYEEIMLAMLVSGHPALMKQRKEGGSSPPSFPELMSTFCDQPNGRYKLLDQLKKRFSTIESFPELYGQATKFHRELGTFFPIKTIVTTNWDEFFERVCGATPFVFDQDMAFWDAAERRVLKIHGSIANFGSIIADENDYKKSAEELEKGIIGSVLKTILATKTVIFIGYSLSDSDFNSIYEFVRKQMSGMHRQAYVVTPFQGDAEKFREIGLCPIITDGTYFVKKLKEHKIILKHFLPDDVFIFAYELLAQANREHVLLHSRVKFAANPHAIFSAFYQDGMLHSLERALAMRGSGQYSHKCDLEKLISKYEVIKSKKLKAKNFGDVAYIEGYINGLVSIASYPTHKPEDIPMYFAFETEISNWNIDHYMEKLPEFALLHADSFAWAEKAVGELDDPETTEWHHPPWL